MMRLIKRKMSSNFKGYRELKQLKAFADFKPEVFDALASRKVPVVALESTIITHGMPYPHNLQVAKEVEGIVEHQASLSYQIL